jgi:predicted metal-dependent RNase
VEVADQLKEKHTALDRIIKSVLRVSPHLVVQVHPGSLNVMMVIPQSVTITHYPEVVVFLVGMVKPIHLMVLMVMPNYLRDNKLIF